MLAGETEIDSRSFPCDAPVESLLFVAMNWSTVAFCPTKFLANRRKIKAILF